MAKRTIPVCCTPEQYRAIERLAKERGMVDAGQAVQEILG